MKRFAPEKLNPITCTISKGSGKPLYKDNSKVLGFGSNGKAGSCKAKQGNARLKGDIGLLC